MKVAIRKKWLCLALIFSMIILGISAGNLPSDFFFEDAKNMKTSTYSSISAVIFDSANICTSEQIGIRSGFRFINRGRLQEERAEGRVMTVFSMLAVLLDKIRVYYETACKVQAAMTDSHHVIISYIHQQDGLKG